MKLYRFAFAFVLLMIFHPLASGAESPMALYEYDSSLAWGHRLNQLVGDILQTVMKFLKPVDGRISSHFGTRKHPLLGVARHHDGVDIACRSGSEVRAVLPGKIIRAGRAGGYGNLIGIAHTGDFSESRYGHLSTVLVKSGQVVRAGDLIGYSGNTGLSTGPHLHFELFQEGRLVNPEAFLHSASASVSRQDNKLQDIYLK